MSEKTEQPTPKRTRDARKKGQVAKSKEVPSVIIILAIAGTLFLMSDFYLEHLESLMILPIEFIKQPFTEALNLLIPKLLKEVALLITPLIATAFIAALIGNIAQTGMLFAVDPIIPKFEKIDPMKGLKRMVSIKNLMELFKSLLKVTILSLFVWMVLRKNLGTLMDIHFCGEQCLLPIIGIQLKQLLLYSSIGFLLIAGADFMFERYQHRKQLRMSKDEVKREYKETEGNPEIKGKRRQLHQELQSSVSKNVKNSNVIVTNPTHVSIGLCYKRGVTPLPVVTVQGTDARAKLIRSIAEQEGIPIMQQVPLARALLADTEPGDYIPTELIQPVAEVLKWAEQVKKRN